MLPDSIEEPRLLVLKMSTLGSFYLIILLKKHHSLQLSEKDSNMI